MKKRLNLNELIWFLILIGFTCYFYISISTGKVTLFVHPKMIKYVKFAVGFFIVLTVFQGRNIFSIKKGKPLKVGYFMFLIPLALGFLLKSGELSIDTVINKGFSLTSQLKINALKHNHTTLEGKEEQCDHEEKHNHDDEGASGSLVANIESVQLVKNGTIVMSNDNFVKNYESIYGNSYNYIGRVINMKGFIYKQKGLGQDEFILSRVLVSCCMADVQLVGLLCDNQGERVFTEGTFVSIEGILGQREYNDSKSGEISIIPIIQVTKIEKTDKISNEYLYY